MTSDRYAPCVWRTQLKPAMHDSEIHCPIRGSGHARTGERPLKNILRIAFAILMVAVAAAIFAPPPLLAQVLPTAVLEGTVTDPSGAVIPSASVEVVDTATSVKKQTISDAQGRFMLS